ncbi:unnamed protein product [Protopolystoma xenopodis]|uniref:Uncharacterized protein n=1 Tax=Protopolystoma xenopodis TaxID=117903 RepID=A0A3S5CGA1_9PLAT|nr:unnamed protein product [Protopolystoma xenopodis]
MMPDYTECDSVKTAVNLPSHYDQFICCGVNSAADYINRPIPRSCGISPAQSNARLVSSALQIMLADDLAQGLFAPSIQKPEDGVNDHNQPLKFKALILLFNYL